MGIKHLYKTDDLLGSEHQLAKILGMRKGKFPSARSLYRVLASVDHWGLKQLDVVNFSLIKREREFLAKKRWLTLDIDQTKKLTEGKTIEQAKPCYDAARKGKLGLRLSLAQVDGLVFSQRLEPGNIGNSQAFGWLLTDTLTKLSHLSHPIRGRRVGRKKFILRIDGGYFSAKTLEFLHAVRKSRRLEFVIRCRSDLTLLKEARMMVKPTDWQSIDEHTTVLRLPHQQVLSDWSGSYTVLIIRQKQERIVSRKRRIRTIKKMVDYALVTTLTRWQSKRILTFYRKRQTIENIFRDFNQSFEAETLPSHRFWGNALYFQMVSLVSNVAVFLKARPYHQPLPNGYTGNHTGQIHLSCWKNHHWERAIKIELSNKIKFEAEIRTMLKKQQRFFLVEMIR